MVDDKGVDLAELSHRGVTDALHVGLAARVGLDGDASLVRLFDEPHRLRHVFLGAEWVRHTLDLLGHIADDDVSALAGKHNRVRTTLTARASSDDCGLSIESAQGLLLGTRAYPVRGDAQLSLLNITVPRLPKRVK